jgi:hypothetical protein
MSKTATLASSEESVHAAMCRGYRPVCNARDQTGAWARSATADAARLLPPAVASQVRRAGAPRLRPDPRDGAPPVPLLCRPKPFAAASSRGWERVDPRHHRSGTASTRRLTTELPLCLCAVPHDSQPVARPFAARGCPVRRASSPQSDVPRYIEPSSALLHTRAGVDPCVCFRLPGCSRLHCIGAFRPVHTRGCVLVAFGPAANAPYPPADQAETCAVRVGAPIDFRAFLHRRVRSVRCRCQHAHTLYFHGLCSPSRLDESSRCSPGSRGNPVCDPSLVLPCTEVFGYRGVCPVSSLAASCCGCPRASAAVCGRPPWGFQRQRAIV